MPAVKLLILFHQGKEHRMLQINKFDNYCLSTTAFQCDPTGPLTISGFPFSGLIQIRYVCRAASIILDIESPTVFKVSSIAYRDNAPQIQLNVGFGNLGE